MKDNIDRLLEAVDKPDRFSDAELEAMLSDPDLRKLYHIMSKTTDAISEASAPDVDKEWESFVASQTKKHKPVILTFFSRHAAAAVVIALTSLAVVAATFGIKYSIEQSGRHEADRDSGVEIASVEEPDTVNDASKQSNLLEPIIVVFKDQSLADILAEIGRYYEVTVSFTNPQAKDLRLYFKWDQSQTITEVADQLNSFEQISIAVSGNDLNVE